MPERGFRLFRRTERIERAEQTARPARPDQLALYRLDLVVRLVLLEAHRHQPVGERLRRRAEGRFGHEGVRPVEGGDPAPRGVGHPQHPPEKLLHVEGAANAGDGAEDVGEGAVPSLLQGLDGDDVFDRAGAVEEVDAVQLPLVAGRDRDLLPRDPFDLRQVGGQRLDRHLLVLRLGLQEDEGPDVVRLVLRARGERRAGGDGPAHRPLPGIVLGEEDRQLDHRLRLQLPGRDAVQDVVDRPALPVPRGGGELDDRRGVHPRLHLPREAGDRVVGLVHDHQRPVDVEQVRERELDPAARQPFEARRGLRDRGEVRLQVLVVGVDLAALGALDPQGLDGADHDAATVAEVVRAELGKVGDVEHPHPAREGFVQRLPVRMAGVLERLDRLGADDVGRREPEHRGMVLLDPRVAGDGDRVGGEDRLAAPGGEPQADVGDLRQAGERGVGARVAAEARRLLGGARDRLVGVLRPGDARLLEEAAEDVEGVGLVLLELHRDQVRARTS